MALIELGAVTLAYALMWFIAAGRVLTAENRDMALNLYSEALSKGGTVYAVYALYAFGLRFAHGVVLVSWLIDAVDSVL